MENPFGNKDRTMDQAITLIAQSLSNIAQSFSIYVAHQVGMPADQTAMLKKITADLKDSHDKLVAAVNAAQLPAKQ